MNNKIVSGSTAIIPNELNKAGIHTLKNYLATHNVMGKVIGMRLELNVKWGEEDGELIIADDTRLNKAWPDLKAAIDSGARVAIMYHVEDKKEVMGEKFKDNRLLFEAIQKRVNKEIGNTVMDRVEEPLFMGNEAKEKLAQLKAGEIDVLLMQNVRLDESDRAMEKKNNLDLVQPLADVFDIMVDSGTGLMHRNAATNLGIKQLMREVGNDVVAGDIFVTDTAVLHRLINGFKQNPAGSVVLTAGAKIANTYDGKGKVLEEGKISLFKSFVDMGIGKIVVGGRMVNPFLVALGKSVGAIDVNPDEIDMARDILSSAAEKGTQIILPSEFLTVHKDDLDKVFDGEKVETMTEKDISEDRVQLDIGPAAAGEFARIVETSEFRLYNGPMGVFENPQFAEGTLAVAQAFANVSHGFGILGGGDTNAAIAPMLSTSTPNSEILSGGGAPFKFILEAGNLPTISAMISPQ
jgi:phosphoglycerate kinase